jgi:hypothetical protein
MTCGDDSFVNNCAENVYNNQNLYMLFTDEAFETVFLMYIILTCGVMKIHMQFILPVIDNNFLLMFGQVLLVII